MTYLDLFMVAVLLTILYYLIADVVKFTYRYFTNRTILHVVYNAMSKKLHYPKSKLYLSKDKKILIVAYGKHCLVRLQTETLSKHNKLAQFSMGVGVDKSLGPWKRELNELKKVLAPFQASPDLTDARSLALLLSSISFTLAKIHDEKHTNVNRNFEDFMLE